MTEPIICQWALFDDSMKNQPLKSVQGISQMTKQISGPNLGPVPQPKPYNCSDAKHPAVMHGESGSGPVTASKPK